MSASPLNPMLLEARRRREAMLAEASAPGYHMVKKGSRSERAYLGTDARSHFKNGKLQAIGLSARDGEKGIKASVPDGAGRTKVIGHFKSHGEAHKAIVSHFEKAGKLAEAATAEAESPTSKTPASVHVGKVFDDKDPADSYPAGTEINFGETAPVDMGGIPDLFDPAAVTGDGI